MFCGTIVATVASQSCSLFLSLRMCRCSIVDGELLDLFGKNLLYGKSNRQNVKNRAITIPNGLIFWDNFLSAPVELQRDIRYDVCSHTNCVFPRQTRGGASTMHILGESL